MDNKTKFAIGCLVQWYEIEIIEEYIKTLIKAKDYYNGKILIDFKINLNQDLEKCISSEQFRKIKSKFTNLFYGNNLFLDCKIDTVVDTIYTIADYRRDFNQEYCTKADVLIWGESDILIPVRMFEILHLVHEQNKQTTPKYVATFATCKMWDDSWKDLEHVDFTDKPFVDNDYVNWWSVKYTMSEKEMNRINGTIDNLQIKLLLENKKFNGCGLVVSSEVIKSGVNIPLSVTFVHEDTAFLHLLKRVLPDCPQYVIKNVLLVHNRNHPKKRMYVKDETGDTLNKQRRSNKWYVRANKLSEENCYNLFNIQYKSHTKEEIFNLGN